MNLSQLPGLLLMGDADASFVEEIFGSAVVTKVMNPRMGPSWAPFKSDGCTK